MWYRQLMNLLFGWEYAVFTYGFSQYIRRVYYDPSGKRFCILYTAVIFEWESRYNFKIILGKKK